MVSEKIFEISANQKA